MRYALYVTLLTVAALLVASTVAVADEPNVRIVGKTKYQILEAKELYIYSTTVLVRKATSEKNYFFSVGPTGEILPLTILNLKKAFPDNHTFHDYLDMTFSSNSGLTAYDDFHKMFKVNRLLAASKER